MFSHAITRLPGENCAEGLTTASLGKPSFNLILKQHHAYRQTLLGLGLDVIALPAEPAFPDGYFVEDPAIITPHIAVITRPSVPSRQGEGTSLEPFISYYRPVFRIQPGGTLEGGDVMMVENHFFIGISKRTNKEGATQLAELLADAGHTSETVPVEAGLHLKSDVNYIGNETLLVTERFVDYPGFRHYRKISVDEDEQYAANSLLVNGSLIVPKGFPKTLARLDSLGYQVIELDVSEVRKMDGGLTCMSLRF